MAFDQVWNAKRVKIQGTSNADRKTVHLDHEIFA